MKTDESGWRSYWTHSEKQIGFQHDRAVKVYHMYIIKNIFIDGVDCGFIFKWEGFTPFYMRLNLKNDIKDVFLIHNHEVPDHDYELNSVLAKALEKINEIL